MEQFSTPQNTPIRKILKEINANERISNKSSVDTQPPAKSSLTLDSDISGIEGTWNDTLPDEDTSYRVQNPNASLGDLLNGFGGLQLNTPKREPNPKAQDASNSMSSDEEMFQECESGYDLDTTAVSSAKATVQAHSSNIDHNVFDKTINYSTIVGNSTAGLITSTFDVSQVTEKSDTLFKTVSESPSNTPDIKMLEQKTTFSDSQFLDVEQLIRNVDVNRDLSVIDEDTTSIDEFHQPAEFHRSVNEARAMDTTVDLNGTESGFTPDLTILEESEELAMKVKLEIEKLRQHAVDENINSTTDLKSTAVEEQASSSSVQQVVPPADAVETETAELNTTETKAVPSTFPETTINEPIDMISTGEESLPRIAVANQTFEAMDVDMNGTLDLTDANRPLSNQPVLTPPITTSQINTTTLNQTIEMTKCDTDDGAISTVTFIGGGAAPDQSSSETDVFFTNRTMPLNVTQDLDVEPKRSAELNQTVVLSTEETCIKKSDTTMGLGVTRTFSKELLLSSTRLGSMDEVATDLLPTNKANNLDGTELRFGRRSTVTNNADDSSVIIPSSPTIQLFKLDDTSTLAASNTSRSQFKLPAVPLIASTPCVSKPKAQGFEVSDDEFQTPGLILNPNDFDFLLSKGNSAGHINARDSILERFDPILGRKSIAPAALITHSEPSAAVPATPTFTPHTISIIKEVDSSCEASSPYRANDQLISINSPTTNQSASNERSDASDSNNLTVKLATAEKTEHSNGIGISGDGDHSQASSTTETYETASIGEPQKADVTMSVGLIHDLKMDNMKSLEQDKVESNLKMNDEHKVKQEMIGDIERKLKEAEAREEALLRRITEKEKALNKMSSVVENYEKTIVEMISGHEQTTQNYEKQLVQLKGERDANFHHLSSLENTFSDLHVKYEKSKQMAVEVKESEAKLVEKLEFCQTQMKLQEQRYDKLKNHALSQLEGANAKLEALSRAHSNESKKLAAQLKKEEISRQSIMEQLAQKTKENAELVKICDELINNGADGS